MHARNHLKGGEDSPLWIIDGRGNPKEHPCPSSSPSPPWLVLLTRMDRRHFSGNRDDEYESKGPQTSPDKIRKVGIHYPGSFVPVSLFPCSVPPRLLAITSHDLCLSIPRRDKQFPPRCRFENGENFLIHFFLEFDRFSMRELIIDRNKIR